MGREKGLIRLAGRPLISYVAAVLDGVTDEIVVSVAKGMSDSYKAVLGRDIKMAEDRRPGLGPLEGLVSALAAAQGQYVLVSPCDTPLLRPAMCTLIADRARGYDGAVPRTGGKFEPLHASYARDKALGAFRRTISRGRRKPIEAYGELRLVYIEEDELRAVDPELLSFWNLNSPADLKLAERRLGI